MTTTTATATRTIVEAACRAIERSERPPPLRELAAAAGYSPSHFQRLFTAHVGISPSAYAAECRARRVREALAAGHSSVTDAAHAAGYGSSGRFYEQTDRVLGMRPTAYRARGDRETIRFAVAQCSLGAVLVAATDIGVCAIFLGDDPAPLVDDLQRRFVRAEIVGADASFEHHVSAVVGLIDRGERFDVPLDIRGTAFQRQVWEALRAVPAGSTISYAELAARIGRPSATRAVANACGANPLAVAVPCHRIVRVDGGLGGYRWGVDRKRELLDREQQR